ncbi:MAG: hypothetical protein RR573_02120 [Oscillospiraceae bacterium]
MDNDPVNDWDEQTSDFSDTPRHICACILCGDYLYEGDANYELDGEHYCVSCMKAQYKIVGG